MPATRSRSFLIAALAAAVVAAQDTPAAVPGPRAQPSAVELGTLAVDANVEAELGVFWTDAALAKAQAEVVPPAGASVLSTRTIDYSGKALTLVEFAVDTATARAVDGVFTVRCGTQVATVPLRAQIVAMPPGGSRVLVAETPFDAFATDDPQVFSAWREVVAGGRLAVDYRLVQRGRPTFDVGALGRADVVLAGEDALLALDDLQVARLQGFVCGGGRLIVCANAFFVGTVRGANRVAEAFDVAIVDREPMPMVRWRADATGITRHALTVGVEELGVSRPSPLSIGNTKGITVLATLTEPVAQPFVVVATAPGGGELVAIGDSLWWDTAGSCPGFARLLRNLLQRPPRLR